MRAGIGRVQAQLAEPLDRVAEELVALINRNVNPPDPVEAGDVYVRAMYAVSDEVNSFGGSFPEDEHEHLARLLVDSPVLVGHRKDRLPVGRTFHAAVVGRDGRSWIKSYFYWLRSAQGADDLLANVDGGVYKECSIGFTFALPECSVCGRDIRQCEHEPNRIYARGGGTVRCYFNYRRIERVLETSLVYRGALGNTAVSKDLAEDGFDYSVTSQEPSLLDDLSGFEPDSRLLVTPEYEGLPVTVLCNHGVLIMKTLTGSDLPTRLAAQFESDAWPEGVEVFGILVACREHRRLEHREVIAAIESEDGPSARLDLKLLLLNGQDLGGVAESGNISIIPHTIVTASEVDRVAAELATCDGLRIWRADSPPPDHAGFRYQPCIDGAGEWSLHYGGVDDCARLVMRIGGKRLVWRLRQLHPARLRHGARFVGDQVKLVENVLRDCPSRLRGRIERAVLRNESMVMELSGGLGGSYVLQPVRLDGAERFLFYRLSTV